MPTVRYSYCEPFFEFKETTKLYCSVNTIPIKQQQVPLILTSQIKIDFLSTTDLNIIE